MQDLQEKLHNKASSNKAAMRGMDYVSRLAR